MDGAASPRACLTRALAVAQVMWLLGQTFKTVAERVRWVGYLSSTSVYGGHNGDWVDEG